MKTKQLTTEELLAEKDKRIERLEDEVRELEWSINELEDEISDLDRELQVKDNETQAFKGKFGDFVNPDINTFYLLSTFIEKYEKYGSIKLEEMLNKL